MSRQTFETKDVEMKLTDFTLTIYETCVEQENAVWEVRGYRCYQLNNMYLVAHHEERLYMGMYDSLNDSIDALTRIIAGF